MTTHTELTQRIDAHLRRAARRVRARRLVVTLSGCGLAIAVVGAVAASWEAALVVAGADADAARLVAPLRLWIVLAVVGACAIAWTRGVSRSALARDVDRRLGLADRTATALAIAGGDVVSTLGGRVLADTSASLEAAGPELERAFPSRPRPATLRLLRAGSILVAIWVGVVLASRFVGSGGGGQTVPLMPGTAPNPVESAQQDEGTALPPDEGSDEQTPAESEPEAQPADTPQDEEREEPETPDPPAPPAGPQATAELVMSSDVYSPGDDVLALGVAKPGAGLEAPAGFLLSVEIDGKVLGTGESTALDPAVAKGSLTPLRLGRLPGGAAALQPGEHEAVLVLEPENGGGEIRSEPQRFRVRGDQSGDGQGEPPPPKPEEQPQPQPPPQQQPQPQEQEPEDGAAEEEPPEEAEPPPLPESTERKVVVPLFGEGEEIEKVGPRLVLVPGGGPESPPRRVPLDEAWDMAQKRAEALVDRAGVRAEDRDLVRRYFERLRRLAEREQ